MPIKPVTMEIKLFIEKEFLPGQNFLPQKPFMGEIKLNYAIIG